MRNGRAAIIPAILALGVAGSILATPAVSQLASHAPTAHVQQVANGSIPYVYYHL